MQEVNGPWFWKAAEKFGVPVVLLGVLIWFLVFHVDGDLHNITVSQNQMTQELALHKLDSAYSVNELQRMRDILRQICVNTAEDAAARNSCFSPQ